MLVKKKRALALAQGLIVSAFKPSSKQTVWINFRQIQTVRVGVGFNDPTDIFKKPVQPRLLLSPSTEAAQRTFSALL